MEMTNGKRAAGERREGSRKDNEKPERKMSILALG